MRRRWLGCFLWMLVALGCREAKKEVAVEAKKASSPGDPAKAAVGSPETPAGGSAGGSAKAAGDSAGDSAKAGKESAKVEAPPAAKVPPVPELLQKRIRYQLREVSPAPVALREAKLVPAADGSAEVVGFYEFSVYEDCVKRVGGSRKAAREQCVPELETIYSYNTGDREEQQVRLNRECKRYGLFYARVGAATDPAKGALTVAHDSLPEEDCELSSSELVLVDQDLDGRRELVADMSFGREVIEDQRRGNAVVDAQHRYLWVLEVGAELRRQFELVVNGEGEGAEVTWVDLDRDERLDLVHKVGCSDQGFDPEGEQLCDDEVRARVWYRYDRERDTWLDDEAKQAPATGGAP